MRQDHLGQGSNTYQDGHQDSPQDVLDRLSVSQAAERLGVTQDAIRKRIARGTIRHDKDSDGRIFVYLDNFERESGTVQDNDRHQASKTVQDDGQDKYTRSLEDQIDFLRRELECKDTIIMSLTQRLPELEPSPEARDAHETASKDVPDDQVPPSNTEEPRASWWKRFFGFDTRGTG